MCICRYLIDGAESSEEEEEEDYAAKMQTHNEQKTKVIKYKIYAY